jgi:predicted nucleotidyltransferase
VRSGARGEREVVEQELASAVWYAALEMSLLPARDVANRLARYFASADAPGVVSVYLFGSHASGRAHRESDVDLGVLLDWTRYASAVARFDVRLRLAGELPAALGSAADVVILNDAPPGLGRAVITHGVRVFLADPALDHAFLRDVQLRAADLDPWLRRMRRVKLETIKR